MPQFTTNILIYVTEILKWTCPRNMNKGKKAILYSKVLTCSQTLQRTENAIKYLCSIVHFCYILTIQCICGITPVFIVATFLQQVAMLSKFSEAIRSNLTKIQRLKIVGIVTVEVHARDIIEKLIKTGCNDITAFEWLSQLRLYWDRVRRQPFLLFFSLVQLGCQVGFCTIHLLLS